MPGKKPTDANEPEKKKEGRAVWRDSEGRRYEWNGGRGRWEYAGDAWLQFVRYAGGEWEWGNELGRFYKSGEKDPDAGNFSVNGIICRTRFSRD